MKSNMPSSSKRRSALQKDRIDEWALPGLFNTFCPSASHFTLNENSELYLEIEVG